MISKIGKLRFYTTSVTGIFSLEEFSVPDTNITTGIFEYPNLHEPSDFDNFKDEYLEIAKEMQSKCRPEVVDNDNFLEYVDIIDELSNNLCLYLDATEFVMFNFGEEFDQVSESYYDALQYLHQLNNDKSVFDTLLKILSVSESETSTLTSEEELLINRLIDDMQIPFSEESDELIRLNTQLDTLIQKFYTSYDQETLRDILLTRHEFAQRMNMDSFSQMEFFRDKHALETPEVVLGFLETVDYINRNFEPKRRILKVRDSFDERNVRWSTDEVMKGLEIISREIVGIELKPARMSQSEQWNKHVRKMTCHDAETDEKIGIVYIELFFDEHNEYSTSSFPRLGKKKSGQIPVCVARCRVKGLENNLDMETGDVEFCYSDLRSFFHEIGHCFHGILGQTNYQFISGARSSKDTIEIPSIFLEYLLENFQVMKRFDEEEGKFTEDEFYHLVDMYHQYFYLGMTRQIQDSKLFLLLHQIPNEMMADNESIFRIENQHIITYGPSYYTYLLSNVVAAQVYEKHFRTNPFVLETKKEQIQNIFRGGEMHSSDLIEKILDGQQINPIHLFDLLNK